MCMLVIVCEFEDDCCVFLNFDFNDIVFLDVIVRYYFYMVKIIGQGQVFFFFYFNKISVIKFFFVGYGRYVFNMCMLIFIF